MESKYYVSIPKRVSEALNQPINADLDRHLGLSFNP